jgi:hypothetical protein
MGGATTDDGRQATDCHRSVAASDEPFCKHKGVCSQSRPGRTRERLARSLSEQVWFGESEPLPAPPASEGSRRCAPGDVGRRRTPGGGWGDRS